MGYMGVLGLGKKQPYLFHTYKGWRGCQWEVGGHGQADDGSPKELCPRSFGEAG